MNPPAAVRTKAPRRATSLVLSAGVALAAVCFLVAGVAELAGVEPGAGEMTDLAAVLDGLLALTPWAWATLGAYAVIVTPFAGLVATCLEYVRVGDRRGLVLAVAVIGVLVVSVLVALWR